MSSPYSERNYRDSEQQWKNVRGRRSSDFHGQQFASPYRNSWRSLNDRSAGGRSGGQGSPAPYFQGSERVWQNNGRSSYGSSRGTPGNSYKRKNQYAQQEVDIRDYVIPAMTGNPWKNLEEQWKSERTSTGVHMTGSS